MAQHTKRMHTSERKAQIIEAAMSLINQRGLSFATTERIATAVDITQPALYRHFRNRKEIIVATLQKVTDFYADILVHDNPSAIEGLNEVASNLYDATIRHPEYAKVMFEFICAPPEVDLREEISQRLSGTLLLVENMLDDCIEEGTVKEPIDTNLVAWEIFSLGFTLNFANILGGDSSIGKEKTMSVIKDILSRKRDAA